MSRFYTVVFPAVGAALVAVTAAQDLFTIQPAANKPVRIWKIKLGQTSDLADAAEEILDIRLMRVPATITITGGTANTPRLVAATGAAFGGTATTQNTTLATSTGTIEMLETFSPNTRVGEDTSLIPESLYTFVNGTAMVLRLFTAPTDSLSMSGTMLIEELG